MENRISADMRRIWNPIVMAGPALLPAGAIAPSRVLLSISCEAQSHIVGLSSS